MGYLTTGVADLVGLLLLVSGGSKLPRLRAFRAAVRAYKLLPEPLVPAVAATVPVLEFAMGVVLLLGWETRIAAAGALVLIATFTSAVVINLLNHKRIDCGCFGISDDTEISWALVGRNVLLLGLTLVAMLSDPSRAVAPSLRLPIAVTVVLCALGGATFYWAQRVQRNARAGYSLMEVTR